MKRKRLLAGVVGCLVAGAGLFSFADGEELRPPAAQVPGIEELSGHLAELVPMCLACHGENGVPNYAESPVIDGQHEGYLYIQLRDYKKFSCATTRTVRANTR